jgi:hypothetical protein
MWKIVLIAALVYFAMKYIVEPSPIGQAAAGILAPIGAQVAGLGASLTGGVA